MGTETSEYKRFPSYTGNLSNRSLNQMSQTVPFSLTSDTQALIRRLEIFKDATVLFTGQIAPDTHVMHSHLPLRIAI